MLLPLTLRTIDVAPPDPAAPYRTVAIRTDRGTIEGRWYESPNATRGVIWVGGVGGGFDTPAQGLYPLLGRELAESGFASLRLRFRDPSALDAAAADVLAGIGFLTGRGVASIALVGHSFGGAVVLRAAVAAPTVRAVVTLATQGYGADAAAELDEGCAVLAVHGLEDSALPADCSRYVHDLAPGPKRLVLLRDTGHVLDEAAGTVRDEVRAWLLTHLPAG